MLNPEELDRDNGASMKNVASERLLDVITSIGKVVTVSGSLQAVMDVVAEECARLTHADGATIFMVENRRLSAKSAVGSLGFVMLDIPLGASLPSHAVRAGHAIRCSDSETDDRTLRRVSSRAGTRSSVSAPFAFGEGQKVAGVLHVASTSMDAFTEEDEGIIQIFANVVGAAIQNARQYDRAVRESRTGVVAEVTGKVESDAYMIGTSGTDFRAVKGTLSVDGDGNVALPRDCAKALGVRIGDSVRFATLRAPGTAPI